jgi:hypothetical protein
VVSGFDAEGVSGVDDPDVDALPGDDEGAAAGHPTLHAQRLGGRCRWWAGGAGVAEAGQLGGGERVGQAAQQSAVVDELQQAAVDAHGHAPTREVVSDRVLPAGEADQAGGVDQPVHLDRAARLPVTGGRRWLAGGPAASASSCRSCAVLSRDGTVLSRTPLTSGCTTVA